MKELIIVSKTHLDLGFTDYALNIREKYLNDFIPQAIKLADTLNSKGEKKFVWTTGSWILNEALNSGNEKLRNDLIEAIRHGYIAAHAMPFTTHTELLDKDLLEYGLSFIDNIDAISGTKTIAAKMTDVPGHTAAILPHLAKRGIKLLHIGVNGASRMPNVPECFLWKFGGSEIVVIYSGDYGGVFKSEYIDDILFFDHTLDNRGVNSAEKILKKFNSLQKKYPDYKVRAGKIDDIAESLWKVRNQLPIVESEIGDTWIHGIASDPYKTAAYRTLLDLKSKWLSDGSMTINSDEYCKFANELLCIAEHTWGMDTKTHFGDMENYLKKDFERARAKDLVRIRHPFGYFPNSFTCFLKQLFGKEKLRYSNIETSWREQRSYIDSAVNSLNNSHKIQAQIALEKLRPNKYDNVCGNNYNYGDKIVVGNKILTINRFGGINYSIDGNTVLNSKDNSILEYRSYNSQDYDYWLKNYTRNYSTTRTWAEGDFARPGLKKFNGIYPVGAYGYEAYKSQLCEIDGQKILTLHLNCPKNLSSILGAPYNVHVIYTLTEEQLIIKLLWLNKDAVRTTESVALRLYPNTDSGLKFVKMEELIEPADIVSGGGRKLMAVERTEFVSNGKKITAICKEAPLIATDGGNILHFDDAIADNSDTGLAYILYNNVWGTNFPLWYDESAAFEVIIK